MVRLTMDFLKDLEESIFLNSSIKEKIFYNFLSKKQGDESFVGSSLEEQVFSAAFIEKKSGVIEPLIRLRQTKPYKGMHYSQHLISLLSAAQLDFDGEKQNVEEYISKHSEKEQYIINQTLGKCYQIKSNPQNSIEKLAFALQEDNINEIIALTEQTLDDIHDVFDYFIFRKSIFRIALVDREQSKFHLLPVAVSQLNKVSRRLNWFIMAIVCLPLIFLGGTILLKAFQYTVTGSNWNVAEPFTFWIGLFLQYALPLIFLIMYLFDIKVKQDVNFREYLLLFMYKILLLDFNEIKQVCETGVANESEN